MQQLRYPHAQPLAVQALFSWQAFSPDQPVPIPSTSSRVEEWPTNTAMPKISLAGQTPVRDEEINVAVEITRSLEHHTSRCPNTKHDPPWRLDVRSEPHASRLPQLWPTPHPPFLHFHHLPPAAALSHWTNQHTTGRRPHFHIFLDLGPKQQMSDTQ